MSTAETTEPMLYVWDNWGECTIWYRDAKGLRSSAGDELPENFYGDYRGVTVWDGEILDCRGMSDEDLDAKGLPYSARDCEEWWQGTFRDATDAEILAVFGNGAR